MDAFRRLTTPILVLEQDDVDTDQIIPARFLKGTTRDGLAAHLFADWRYDREGRSRPDFVLNAVDARQARALIVGRNFGCGSSREHAVWALAGFGLRAVIGLSFGDIFRANALKNGLLPIVLDAECHARLRVAKGGEVTIDLEAQTVGLADGTRASFSIEPFGRYCLLEGLDELDFLRAQEPAIVAYERTNPNDVGG